MSWPAAPRAVMNRAMFARWTGIPYETLRAWEAARFVETLDIGGRPYYTPEHLAYIIKKGLLRRRGKQGSTDQNAA